MRPAFIAVLCALGYTYTAAHNKRDGYVVKESHVVPLKWKQLHRAPADHTITLRIGLKQKSFDELERHLYEVSDPDHQRYGQHLSQQEIHDLVAPGNDASAKVHQWLADNNVQLHDIQYSPAKDWMLVDLSVAEIEALLDTEYHVYENDEGTRIVRTPQYSLPIGLQSHIEVVQPTNYFGDQKAMRRPFRLGSMQPDQQFDHPPHHYSTHNSHSSTDFDISKVCNESAVTNRCLRTLYRTVGYVPQVPQQNAVAMTAYLNETANVMDFHIFLSRQRQDASLDYTYNYTTINGGPNNQSLVPKRLFGSLDAEANLDSQIVGGFVYPTKMRVYSTGSKPPFHKDRFTPTDSNEPYLDWLSYVLALDNPPHTISTSYGDDEQAVPYRYAKRVCQEFAQLGARGVSLFFSSGDDGVGPNGTCISNDGKKKRMFLPEFPPSCPYVTSVGGTRGFNPEIVAWDPKNGYVSGSGISNYFPRPAYQSTVVDKYLSSIGDLQSGLYNTTGRAYPDIAA